MYKFRKYLGLAYIYNYIHDVIGDVERKRERKKERKKERHLRQWKNENESCLMCTL